MFIRNGFLLKDEKMGGMKKMIKVLNMGNHPLMDYNVNLAVCELLYKFFIVIVSKLLSLPNTLSKHLLFVTK